MNSNKLIRILFVLLLIFLARLCITKNIPFSLEVLAPLKQITMLSTEEVIPDYVNAFPELYAYEETFLSTPSEIDKIVYLTFDDGPSKNTEKILETSCLSVPLVR